MGSLSSNQLAAAGRDRPNLAGFTSGTGARALNVLTHKLGSAWADIPRGATLRLLLSNGTREAFAALASIGLGWNRHRLVHYFSFSLAIAALAQNITSSSLLKTRDFSLPGGSKWFSSLARV
jgi:hypothetical protein